MTKHLQTRIPGIDFVANTNRNDPKRILSNDKLTKSLVLQMAEDSAKYANHSQLDVLKRASHILRSISLKFINLNKTDFQGSVVSPGEDAPIELELFLKCFFAGTRDLNETANAQVDSLANTHAQILISNMKSDYQIEYDSKNRNADIRAGTRLD